MHLVIRSEGQPQRECSRDLGDHNSHDLRPSTILSDVTKYFVVKKKDTTLQPDVDEVQITKQEVLARQIG